MNYTKRTSATLEYNKFLSTLPDRGREVINSIKTSINREIHIKDEQELDYLYEERRSLYKELGIILLGRFIDSDLVEKAYNSIKNKEVFIRIFLFKYQFNKSILRDVFTKEIDLQFPKHDCWSFTFPIKGKVSFDNENDIRDLGIVFYTKWSAIIIHDEDEQCYLDGDKWLSDNYYKELFNCCYEIGIFDNEDRVKALENCGYIDKIFKTDTQKIKNVLKV